MSSGDRLNRPSPPPLPREQQREFEELVRQAQAPLSSPNAEFALHPDARPPVEPEFEGDVNPKTGEQGGPKREPVKKWTTEGDWSFKGRVSDF
ncbi:putative mitochondrial protein, conserved [Steccherinum ochraceum]|uniref:Succinate dehydrogenase assembly factor 4, mitochondrial n=1 Tax=Steccherinum ochraceum TaxID=92696 RepID=A0A4R0R898_9APHY|nr:putative mitochondrial protein, conserved [Steccherinum ochraceum]